MSTSVPSHCGGADNARVLVAERIESSISGEHAERNQLKKGRRAKSGDG
jgi:hypothetical protein